MYKLDGRISDDYCQEKHNEWHDEKDKLIEKLKAISSTSRTFDLMKVRTSHIKTKK